MTASAKRMKSPPSTSFDVFEFKEEDDLAEMAAKTFSSTFVYPRALDRYDAINDHVSGIKTQSNEIEIGLCEDADAANIDYNHTVGSFNLIETEDLSKETPKSGHVLHNDFTSHEPLKPSIIGSGSIFASVESGSGFGATVCFEDPSNCGIPESSCNDHLASDDNKSMSERSPSAIANNNAASDGQSPENCFSGWNLEGERMGIDFYPDYIDYRGSHYIDTVVKFSRSSVELRSKTIDEEEGYFHIHLEIDDIIKIETQWSARCETGTINIYFISKGVAQDDNVHGASGLEELKIATIDPEWYEKQEAIESLDMRYKALWNVLLDTGMDKCSSLSEEETMFTRRYFPKFDKPFEEVIYPKGDPDAVSISKRDVDLLLPDTFVNDTIIDFYIKYLKTRLNVEKRTKYHFFNCFFFRKLADMDKDPSSAFDGKAAFQRVRKWTRKVNLLEKDFIFIPVNYNYHWSLIVICYFGEVDSYYKDVAESQSVRVPCILHMDSLRGNHVGLKDLIQSYLWEEWKERQKGTCEDLYSKFRNLKFIPLELPQQQNLYDCGLFLLHYVELFLEEVPADFSIYKITSSSTFLQSDWFPPGEASMKRSHIERLISGLLDTDSEDCPPSEGSDDVHWSPVEPKTIQDDENDIEFSVKSAPLAGCRERSLCEDEQAIEMTLLPSSSIRNSECTRKSGLVLKELFNQASASESFTRAPWGGLESSVSIREFKRPLPLIQEEGEASECFVSTELSEPVFRNLDSITPEAPIFQYSSEDFRLESVHQPTSEDIVHSSPVTSGCDSDDIVEVEAGEKWQAVEPISLEDKMHKHRRISPENTDNLTDSFAFSSEQLLNNKESNSPIDDISNRNGESFFYEEATTQLHGPEYLPVGPAYASEDKLDVPECVDETNAAKRTRIMPPDAGEGHTSNLSKDLHL